MNIDLLKKLCDTPGLPGEEDKVKDIFLKEIKKYTSDIKIDILGNVIAHIPGKGPKLVLDAHMDEVGFMINHIDEKGFIHLTPLGGMDPRVFYGQRIVLWGQKPVTGMVGAIPPHISRNTNNREVPDVEDCVVDVGLTPENVNKYLKVGDLATFATALEENEDSVISKALDNRLGLFVMLEALAKKKEINCDLYVTATVQEEVGLRGARIITPVYEPDFAVALEGTVAMDIPGIPDYKTMANTGKGPEIRLSDRYLVAHRPFSFFITGLAEKKHLPYQITVKKAGSTNATAMQVTGKGTRAAVVSVPVRYLHSPSSIAYKSDIQNTIDLIANLIENINLCNMD